MSNYNIIVLIAGTLCILIFSWYLSLRSQRFHGIPRIIAFECIFLLVLLNWRAWFVDPWSAKQLLSWALLLLSILAAGTAFFYYFKFGRPTGEFENTEVIVDTGIYRYIRHPMYLSLILGGFGILFKNTGMVQIGLSILNLLAIFITARIEEGEMSRKFGKRYHDYKKVTWMFIPYLI